MKREFVGYHGTTSSRAEIILQTGYFNFTTGEHAWLGVGIYFYEEEVKDAYYFCVTLKRYPEWKIIKGNLEGDTIVDLEDPGVLEQLKALEKKVKGRRYLTTKDGKPRKILNLVLMNMMFEATPYDIARGKFSEPPWPYIERTNIYRYVNILCVRNRMCIKGLEEVAYCGYE
ncbi:MAG: hypothetical protein ABSA82_01175 [Thermacetogeniaceae bacterium]|jgi:hypothetical protein